MRIRSSKTRQGGHTIVETLIASTILAVMGAGVIGSINYGMMVMRLARENARATQIMLEKTEAIRLYNWDQVNTSNYIPSTFTAPYDPQMGNAAGVTYDGTIYIGAATNVDASIAPNMRQCTITLRWNTAGAISHFRTLSTLIAKDGVQNYVY